MARTLNLIIDQGADWSANLVARTLDDSSILNLVDYTKGTSQIRKAYTSINSTANVVVDIHQANTSGLVILSLTDSVTKNIASGRYLYDVKIIHNDSKKFRIFEGFVDVQPEISTGIG
jgi:hypothetical protein